MADFDLAMAIEGDASGLVQAADQGVGALDRLDKAANDGATGFANLERTSEGAVSAVVNLTGVEQRLDAVIAAVQQSTVGAARGHAALRDAIVAQNTATSQAIQLNEGLRNGTDGVARATKAVGTAFDAAGGSVTRYARNNDILSQTLDRYASASGKMKKASNDNFFAMRSLGQQAGDFATQISLGGGVIQAFSAQVGQAGYAMSEFQSGPLAAVGRFLVGPWGIAFTIAALAIGPLIGKLFEAGDGTDDLAKRQAGLENALDKTTGKVKEQISALGLLLLAQDKQEAADKNRAALNASRRAFDDQLGTEADRTYVVAPGKKGGVFGGTVPFLPQSVSAGGQQILRELQGMADAGRPAVQILTKLKQAAALDPTLNAAAASMTNLSRAVDTNATAVRADLIFFARLAVANGTATEAQRKLVAASTEGAKTRVRDTSSIIEVQAKLAVSTNAVEKAQATLALTRAKGREAFGPAGAKGDQAYLAALTAQEGALNRAQAAVRGASQAKRDDKKATTEAAAEARKAAQANRELEASFDRLSRKLDPVLASLRDYAKALSEIDALKAAGKITEGDAIGLRYQAGQDQRDAVVKAQADAAQRIFKDAGIAIDGGLRDVIDGSDRMRDAAYDAARALDVTLVDAANTVADAFDQLFGGRTGSAVRNLLKGVTGEREKESAKLAKSVTTLASKVGISDETATTIGKRFAQGFSGAQTGASINAIDKQLGISKALGLKSSKTGAEIGGALGSYFGPLGEIGGSILGSVTGGLLKKTKSGSVTLSSATGGLSASGNNSGAKAAASSLGNSIQDGLQSIAQQLGGDLGGFNVTVGQRHGDYRVTTGSSLKVKKGAKDFNGDADAANAYAIGIALTQGAVTGLSAAVSNALRSSTDVDEALSEALKVKDLESFIATAADALKEQFAAEDRAASARVALARKYGVDVVAVEKANADARTKLVNQALQSSVGSLQGVLADLAGGSLFEGSAAEKRTAILSQIDTAKGKVAAGEEGAGDTLADLYRSLLANTREGYGTAGGTLAGDRSTVATGAAAIIAQERDRIERASAAQQAQTDLLSRGNDLANETNNLLAINNRKLDNLAEVYGASGGYNPYDPYATARYASDGGYLS